MSCKEGNIINCINECDNCNDPNLDAYRDRNNQCLQVCGARLKHAYAQNKSICDCSPRTKIEPCTMDDDYERKKCFLKNGYQYWDQYCKDPNEATVDPASQQNSLNPNVQNSLNVNSITRRARGFNEFEAAYTGQYVPTVENYQVSNPNTQSLGGGGGGNDGLYVNDSQYVACDYTFPYNNDIELKYKTPFRGKNKKIYSKQDGGYIKYDQMTNDIFHVSMNPRQGGDEIAKVGILRTPSVDPKFKAEKISNNDFKVNIVKSTDFGNYDKTDRILEDNLENNYISITKNNFRLNMDFYECQYGHIRLVDPDFDDSVHTYSIFGLGLIAVNNTEVVNNNFSGDWLSMTRRRCNKAFGTQQMFGVNGSHWPVMYILRYNKATKEQHCVMIYFDHFRKLEYFFDDFRTTGKFIIRTREPEFRFYVSMGPTIKSLKKQLMKILGPPSPPVQKVMGQWVGAFGFRNWKEIENDIKYLREYKFPVDGFIMDLYWFGHEFPMNDVKMSQYGYANNFCHEPSIREVRNTMGIFQWDKKTFNDSEYPEPNDYIDNKLMNKYDYGLTLIQEPFISADAPDFSYMYNNDMLARRKNGSWIRPEGDSYGWLGEHAAIVDFTNPKTAKYWYESRVKPNISSGTFSWWHDLTEPEISNENALFLGTGQVNDKGVMAHEFKQAPDFYNFSEILFDKGLFEEYTTKQKKRYNCLTRSGTCGIQRYGVYVWPGDEGTNFQSMNSDVIGFSQWSLCGLDFFTTDAGGFTNTDEAQKVYSTWYANACATYYNVKPHKWLKDDWKIRSSAPYAYGDVETNYRNIIERYELSPYYYSSAMRISSLGKDKGKSFNSTLFFEFQDVDPELYVKSVLEDKNNTTAKMVGPNLLYIALLNDQESSKQLYLPANTVWYDNRNSTWLNGGITHTIPIKIKDQLPLLVKNNSIIPTRELIDCVNAKFNDKIKNYKVIIYSYDGQNADDFTLYVDDGISLNTSTITLQYKNGKTKVINDSKEKPNFEFYIIDRNGFRKLNTKENYETPAQNTLVVADVVMDEEPVKNDDQDDSCDSCMNQNFILMVLGILAILLLIVLWKSR